MTDVLNYELTAQENYVRVNGNILAEVRNAVAEVPPWDFAKLFAAAPEMACLLEYIRESSGLSEVVRDDIDRVLIYIGVRK